MLICWKTVNKRNYNKSNINYIIHNCICLSKILFEKQLKNEKEREKKIKRMNFPSTEIATSEIIYKSFRILLKRNESRVAFFAPGRREVIEMISTEKDSGQFVRFPWRGKTWMKGDFFLCFVLWLIIYIDLFNDTANHLL